VIQIDGFLPAPDAVREAARSADFIDWHAPDGEVYKRICICDVPGLLDGIEKAMGPVEMLGMGYRLNYAGEIPNAAIHSDLGWGTHAAVLYLCEGDGGTAFWEHKASGATGIDAGDSALFGAIQGDWNDASKWGKRREIALKYNRCAIYESRLFHSRWPFEAFGDSPANGRLIAVAFFNLRRE
jgi:hypothetical protein